MRLRVLLLAVLFMSCAFEAEPELTCEWTSANACLCSGRQPHDVSEARAACCAADGAPAGACK